MGCQTEIVHTQKTTAEVWGLQFKSLLSCGLSQVFNHAYLAERQQLQIL